VRLFFGLSKQMNIDYLIAFSIVAGVVSLSALATALVSPAKVVEWRLDPPAGEHLMFPAEPTEGERLSLDAQKRIEVLHHSLVYAEGSVSNKGMFKVLNDHWNKPLEVWPQYKEWKISHQWLAANIPQMDFDTSGEVFQLVAANHADARPGHYILVSPADPAAKSRGGRSSGRQLVPIADLVLAWRVARNNGTETAANGMEPPVNGSKLPLNGMEPPVNGMEPPYYLPSDPDLTALLPEVGGKINNTKS
jgi:hypothetical protein